MRTFALLTLAAAASASEFIDAHFIDHVITYGLSFKTFEEFQFRKAVFTETHNFI
jgi:hypothetical protein